MPCSKLVVACRWHATTPGLLCSVYGLLLALSAVTLGQCGHMLVPEMPCSEDTGMIASISSSVLVAMHSVSVERSSEVPWDVNSGAGEHTAVSAGTWASAAREARDWQVGQQLLNCQIRRQLPQHLHCQLPLKGAPALAVTVNECQA